MAFQPCDAAVSASTTTRGPPTVNEPSLTVRSVSLPMAAPLTPVRYSVCRSMREGALRSGLTSVTPSAPVSFFSTSGESELPFAIETT